MKDLAHQNWQAGRLAVCKPGLSVNGGMLKKIALDRRREAVSEGF